MSRVLISALFGLIASSACAESIEGLSARALPEVLATYEDIHSHPELSQHEERTAGLLARQLRQSGYAVTERVGRYADGTAAYGVVATLENGPGPRLLIRADMDALPIVEETGLPYASQVRVQGAAGEQVGVMHACGHDIHTANLIGTAQVMARNRAAWHGTLILVGQPAEETVGGAQALLADHLYERFGTPDYAIALHDTNVHAAGTVAVTSGAALSGARSVDVTMRGIGGHGAYPHLTKDPVVMAAEFIVQVQTIVSRQEDPLDASVVTIGHVFGGTKRNIIPDEVTLELSARAFNDDAFRIILDGIHRTAEGVALSAGVPDERRPLVRVVEESPPTYNDPALTTRVRSALTGALGPSKVFDDKPLMASEDFGLFGLSKHRIPTVMFWLGAMNPAKFAAAQTAHRSLPGPHSSHFEPDPEPTLRTGMIAMSSVATALLQRAGK